MPVPLCKCDKPDVRMGGCCIDAVRVVARGVAACVCEWARACESVCEGIAWRAWHSMARRMQGECRANATIPCDASADVSYA